MSEGSAALPGVSTRQRYLVGGIMAALLAFSLIYLQGLFDKSDHRKAIAKVRQLQTRPGAPTFGGHLAATTQGAVTFSATLLSGCRGMVQVDAHPESGGLLSFQVDLITEQVEPINGAARRALEGYREAWPLEPEENPSTSTGTGTGTKKDGGTGSGVVTPDPGVGTPQESGDAAAP